MLLYMNVNVPLNVLPYHILMNLKCNARIVIYSISTSDEITIRYLVQLYLIIYLVVHIATINTKYTASLVLRKYVPGCTSHNAMYEPASQITARNQINQKLQSVIAYCGTYNTYERVAASYVVPSSQTTNKK